MVAGEMVRNLDSTGMEGEIRRRPPGDHMEQGSAQGIEVRSGFGLAHELLRRHVSEGTHDVGSRLARQTPPGPTPPEIHQSHIASRTDDHVGGFDVAVKDRWGTAVQIVQDVQQPQRHLPHFLLPQHGTRVHPELQGCPLHVLLHDVEGGGLVPRAENLQNLRNSRVTQPGQNVGFPLEEFQVLPVVQALEMQLLHSESAGSTPVTT